LLTYLQEVEEFSGVTVCDKDLLDDTADTIYSAHLAMHSTYGFDLLCQTLDQGMTSSILHFKFVGSCTWVHILVYCRYDPFNTDTIFDGVSIYSPLRSFPCPLSNDSSTDDSQRIIVDLSLSQFDVPPLIDVPSTNTSSTLLLDLTDSPCDEHMAVSFDYWALPVPGCDDLVIDSPTFGDIVSIPRVGGFLVGASFYYDMRHASQLLELV
jgi:hypothetical protein